MSAAIERPWRSWLGNAATLLLLLALGAAMASLHAGGWWTAPPLPSRWWWAGGSVLAYMGWSAWILRRHARKAAPAAVGADAVRVVFASQTGFAEVLATRTAESLRAAGMAASAQAIDTLRPADLQNGRVLFIVSTTGEGDPPDHALAFVRSVMAQSPSLTSLHYAVLALGDHEYQHFCHFGRQLDDWLRQHGAQPLFDRVEVDNADESALRHWQHHLGHLAGASELPDWELPRYQAWTLHAREVLNPGSVGGAVHHLQLSAPVGEAVLWQSGDIAEIGPRHADATVQAWLAQAQWDGALPVQWQGQPMPLQQALAQAHLPAVADIGGRTAQAVVDALDPLPHREYSIASTPAHGTLDLVIRQMQRPDGTPGLGSGWLCLHAPLAAPIALRIRTNKNFHLPVADVPILLIGNGTGIAGLRSHLQARAAQGRTRNWLVFGERQRARDFLFAGELAGWQRDGVLTRCDVAFSRDQEQRVYVQDLLRQHADTVRDWIADGACLFVCGSLEGMAPGVDAALREVLGAAQVEELRAAGRYRRDVY